MIQSINNWELSFERFSSKTRTHISSRLQNIGHAYNRNITVKTHNVYVNTNTLKTFNPKTLEDCAVCKSFSGEYPEIVKQKAYNFIIESMKGY